MLKKLSFFLLVSYSLIAYQEGIVQGSIEYLNMYIRYPYSYKAENVVQTGAAQEGRAGVPNNPVTIIIREAYYQYIVHLPAVGRCLDRVSVNVLPNGNVNIEGIVSAGEITSTATPTIFNRRPRRILPQGHFTINFTLPGPVDPKLTTTKLHPNGVLEGVVLIGGMS